MDTITGAALELCSDADQAPEWVQLFPAGGDVAARDGRRWTLDAAALVGAFDAPIPVDLEHSTQVKGARGEAAPAVGWIEALEAREGAVWGRVAWLAEGARLVAGRAYRFLSPGFLSDRATGRIGRLVSAGLTNTPALRMAALAREDHGMDLTRLAKALGLADDASPETMEARAAELARRPESATVDLARFAPRADVEQALARAQTAEAELAAIKRANGEAEIAAAVDDAVASGRIAPASRDAYVELCRAEGGLARFKAIVAATPPMVGRADPANPAPKTDAPTLTAEELVVCSQLGVAPAEFAKLKAEI